MNFAFLLKRKGLGGYLVDLGKPRGIDHADWLSTRRMHGLEVEQGKPPYKMVPIDVFEIEFSSFWHLVK
jgi:hypothetical protein